MYSQYRQHCDAAQQKVAAAHALLEAPGGVERAGGCLEQAYVEAQAALPRAPPQVHPLVLLAEMLAFETPEGQRSFLADLGVPDQQVRWGCWGRRRRGGGAAGNAAS